MQEQLPLNFFQSSENISVILKQLLWIVEDGPWGWYGS